MLSHTIVSLRSSLMASVFISLNHQFTDNAVQFRFPFSCSVCHRRVGQLLPLTVIENFHSERIIVEQFPVSEEYSQVIGSDFHQFQTVTVKNLVESFHRGEVASAHNCILFELNICGSGEPLFPFLTCLTVLCPDSARLCEKIPEPERRG